MPFFSQYFLLYLEFLTETKKVPMAMFLIVIFLLKLQIKDGLPSNFTSLQKCSTNEFFNLETIRSCHYIQHIILHRNLVCLAISNLKYRNYKFLSVPFVTFRRCKSKSWPSPNISTSEC